MRRNGSPVSDTLSAVAAPSGVYEVADWLWSRHQWVHSAAVSRQSVCGFDE
jgi:hypothetical protein